MVGYESRALSNERGAGKRIMGTKVSVCMPTYNFAPYLAEAIESVLYQTFTDFEFLIIDDCSQDASADIIRHYAERDARIRFIANKHNLGMVENWNYCLQEAGGEYVKYLFGDDNLASRDALARMVSVLDTEPSVALVASARNIIDEQSAILSVKYGYQNAGKVTGTKIIQDCLFEQRNKIGEPSVVLFRKDLALRGFNVAYQQLVDLEMWFALLEQGDFYFIDEPLCSFREHAGQQTKKNLARGLGIDEAYLLLQDYAEKPYVNMSRFKRAYMNYLPAYSVWKLFSKHHKISKDKALDQIREQYGYDKKIFYAFFPAFKLYKLYREVKRTAESRRCTGEKDS